MKIKWFGMELTLYLFYAFLCISASQKCTIHLCLKLHLILSHALIIVLFHSLDKKYYYTYVSKLLVACANKNKIFIGI